MSAVSQAQDLAAMTEAVLTQAIAYCAQKVQLDSPQSVLERLREGDRQVCGYCHYSVAKQVAECLGALDENIKATYLYDYDAAPEDSCLREMGRVLPIHLLVWVERKTAALKVLVETWDCALAQRYAAMIGLHQPAYLLDVQIVDSADVEKRIGYGALLSSLHYRPIQVWKRNPGSYFGE